MARIVVKGRLPKHPIVVEGFPSKGFVSTIASNYLIRDLGMKLVGFVECDALSSIVVIKESKPMRPIRIYMKDNLILIYSEVVVPFTSIAGISKAINNFLDQVKPEMVVLMAGISGVETDKGHEILGVSSSKKTDQLLKDAKVEQIKDGVLTGISSNILMHCVDKDIDTLGLMVETEYNPDAIAAASMLEILNKVLKTNIDVKTLKHMGKDIEKQFKKIIKQMKNGCEGYEKMEETCPMYS